MALLTMDVVLTMTELAVALTDNGYSDYVYTHYGYAHYGYAHTVAIPTKLYWLYRLWFY